jgi:hypothetical protein
MGKFKPCFAIASVDTTGMTADEIPLFIRAVAYNYQTQHPWSTGVLGCGVRTCEGSIEIQLLIRNQKDFVHYLSRTFPALLMLARVTGAARVTQDFT